MKIIEIRKNSEEKDLSQKRIMDIFSFSGNWIFFSLIYTIFFVFFIVNANQVMAIEYPGRTICKLYGGDLGDQNICHLETREKCDPSDKGFEIENEFIAPCKNYAEMPCAKLGETRTFNKCCDDLKCSYRKGYFTESCKHNFPIGIHLSACIKCGDNICDEKYESKCNCPQDCEITVFEKIINWFKIFLIYFNG
ncbi:hypothetical protein HOD96_02180 [Candidatus Falkowbacteria bacterium]|jgi:hypothetical protein|nr:hypothetical protein [Candidatus Falkowbacteria bacterium]MBT4433099.1 hypothetical protein [Candidatus Falkowbacteria bacterium]